MAKKFLTGLNLVVLDADPATGSEGELYFNSSASVAKIYQAGSWSVLGAGGGGGAITVSTTEPVSPETGDAWYKNDTGEFYVYDGTSWVEVNGVTSGIQAQLDSKLSESSASTTYSLLYPEINEIPIIGTWTTQTSNFGNTHINSVAYGNSLWVAVGNTGQIRTSTDAITWTTQESNFGTRILRSVAYGNGTWVAGGGPVPSLSPIIISTDGVTWETNDYGDPDWNFPVGSAAVNSVAYGNGIWVIGGSSGKLATSLSGTGWSNETSNFGNTRIQSVAYGNGLWVAVGWYGQIRTSTDTITWTTQTSNFASDYTGDINSVAYGNGLWVAGGYSGQLRTSTDAITWTTQTSNFAFDNINSVAYDNGLWVAAGYSGQLRTSTETLSYTLQLSDNKSVIETNKTSANTVIVPLNSSVAFPIGSSIDIVQTGVGQTTITPAEGVTIKSSNSETKLTGQYSGSTIYKRATNEWVLFGDLSA